MEFPKLDELNVESQEVVTVEDLKKTAMRIAVIGSGQGGGKIADEFWAQGYRRVLVLNTTDQDMAGLECPNRLIIGSANVGTGKNPEIGRKMAENSREDIFRAIKKSFGPEVDLVLVCCGAGGGSGSGSCPVVIDIVKQYLEGTAGRVGVIAAFPKKSEGAAVMQNAQALMAKIIDRVESGDVAPLIVIDNDKIGKLFSKASITDFYKIANKNIVGLFNVFNELSAQSSPFSSLDPNDLKTVLSSGVIVFGMTSLKGLDDETVIARAIENNVRGGLFSDSFNLNGATHAGAILVASPSTMATIPQSSLDMAFETLQRVMGGQDLVLHSGVYYGPEELGGQVLLYTIAGGLR